MKVCLRPKQCCVSCFLSPLLAYNYYGDKMRIVEKPWGFEYIWAETDDYVAKMLHIEPNQRLSLQYHEKKEETVYVIKGILYNYEADGTITKVYPGQALHINVGQIHRFGANETNVEIVEVSTPYLNDVVRLEDDYDRKEK